MRRRINFKVGKPLLKVLDSLVQRLLNPVVDCDPSTTAFEGGRYKEVFLCQFAIHACPRRFHKLRNGQRIRLVKQSSYPTAEGL